MDPTLSDLWSRHLEGEVLTKEARQRMAAAFAGDAAAWAEALADLRLHAQLRAHLRLVDEDPAFVATVLRQCGYVGDSARFARSVERRLPLPAARRRGSRSRPQRSASRPWWPALAVLGAVAAVLVLLMGRAQAPRVSTWTVTAVVGTPMTAAGPVTVGQRLSERMHIDGAVSDQVHVAGDGMRLELIGARAVVPALSDPRWQLDRGVIAATVAARGERAPFQVVTPHGSAVVIGTRFTVTVTNRTRLAVAEGRVRFGRPGAWRDIGAGEEAELPEPATTTALTPPADPDPRLAMPALLAYYRFDAGGGMTIPDRSGRGPALRIVDPQHVLWSDDGLRLRAETHLLAAGAATHLTDAGVAADAISIEAELTITDPVPFDTAVIGPARIVTLSEGSEQRNATLGWGEIGLQEPALVLRLRQDGDGAPNGLPTHWIPAPSPGRVHVLVTYQGGVGARWYVDGREIPSRTWHYRRREAVESRGSLQAWSRTARLALGGEVEPDAEDGRLRAWLGTYHRVAIYGGAIDAATALRLTSP